MSARILSGPKKETTVKKGLGEYFFEFADQFADNAFQIDAITGETETFSKVRQRSVRVAIELKKIEINPKDIVMLCCYNNLDNIVPCLASTFLGAIVCSVDPLQDVYDMECALALVTPKLIFVVEDMLEIMETALQFVSYKPIIIVIGKSDKYRLMSDMEKIESKEEKHFEPVKVQDVHETAFILFSSGTTSTPKGICISHYSILQNPLNLNAFATNGSPCLHMSSLYWISALIFTASCMISGSAKIIGPKISAVQFIENIAKHKVKFLFATVSVAYNIVDLGEEFLKKFDFSKLEYICVGGSKVELELILKLRQLFPGRFVFSGYASTEAGALITSFVGCDQKLLLSKPTTVGIPAPNVQIKIVDAEQRNLLPPNQEGEILVKSPYLMNGYYNLEKPDIYDEDGFLKTGDIGYYDEDGYLYVTDRLNETFKYMYHKISPSIIEKVLLTHPAVAEAVVIGIPHKTERNHVAAGIVLKRDAKPDVDEIIGFVNRNVPESHKIRAGIRIFDSFPKTPTQKIQRRKIRDSFLNSLNLS